MQDTNVSVSFSAEGKYLTYQWKKDGLDLTGETNATLNITDANATLHDGNYTVVVSNDFGSVESGKVLVDVNTTDGLPMAWSVGGSLMKEAEPLPMIQVEMEMTETLRMGLLGRLVRLGER